MDRVRENHSPRTRLFAGTAVPVTQVRAEINPGALRLLVHFGPDRVPGMLATNGGDAQHHAHPCRAPDRHGFGLDRGHADSPVSDRARAVERLSAVAMG